MSPRVEYAASAALLFVAGFLSSWGLWWGCHVLWLWRSTARRQD